MKKILPIFLCLLYVNSRAQQVPRQFTMLPSSVTGITFRNDIIETPEMFLYKYENLYIGSGVAVGDINNDGLPDVYFSSTLGSNKLYLNLGNLHFKDITESAGVTGGEGIKTGVNMIDINNDGYLDIFVCKSGYHDPSLRKKILYINNKNGTFSDKAKEFGLDNESYTTQAYFFDFDNDGDKDLYLVNHPIDFSKSMTIPATMVKGKLVYVDDTTNTKYVSDRLFENRGNKFLDITAKAGIINHTFGLSASIADVNNDGWPDVYVANDFNKPDYLYINNRNGTFTNRLSEYISHVSFSAMGSDISDINNDGLEDIFVMDMAVRDPVRQKQLFAVNQNYDKFQLLLKFDLFYQYPRNTLQLNNGDNTYSEIGNYAGVAETEWSWSPMIADFDNDGFKDMYITNGLKRDMTDWDYKVFVLDSIMNAMNTGKSVDLNTWLQSMPSVPVQNYFFHNNGSLSFDDYSKTWTDAPASFSNGAAYADLDNDGDLDLIVNNVDAEAFILENRSRQKPAPDHYLRLKFYESPANNKEIYGTIVKLFMPDGSIQLQHYNPQRGFLSTSEHVLHFGTGSAMVIPKMEIIFPGGKKIEAEQVACDKVLSFYLADAVPAITPVKPAVASTFKNITAQNKFSFTQKENEFIDFKREPLIPYKCSRKGPYFAKADVNGDGKEDVYLGGAAGENGVLMIQDPTGNFAVKPNTAFVTDKDFEDMGSVFFDADGDGDMDLYVVSGGAQFEAGSSLYQDRLYVNDGKGNFIRAKNNLPAINSNGSIVTALDFDGDGDLDLFVGGHVLPGSFPKTDRSYLLQNNGGTFTEVTEKYAPALSHIGIVNQAVWADINNDSKQELVITGEWMSPQVFTIQKGIFEKVNYNVHIKDTKGRDSLISMNDLTGWWYNMKLADVDGDGDIDIVLGNRSLNSSIKADVGTPCTVYAKDFDHNGSYDAVLGYYNGPNCYPLFSRDQLIDQMPGMRKKFTRYKDYSGKTMDQIFTAEEKQGMDIYTTRFFESGVLVNEGNNTFSFKPFPELAQLSSISDLVIHDLDADGIKDIVVAGNSDDPAVMIGVYDATAALLLKGKGDGSYLAVPAIKSGLSMKGEVRKIIPLIYSEKINLVFLKNDAPAIIMEHTLKN